MENYINIAGRQIKLTKEQIGRLTEALGIAAATKALAEYKSGDIVRIGNHKMVVLEQHGIETSLILKGFYGEYSKFGENNNYDGSYVDRKCREFAKEIKDIVGEENVVCQEVDLTSNDGLKDYGTITRDASLLTADLYRRYVDVLDTVKPNDWWWLATPLSTKRHANDICALCVTPSGGISGVSYFGGHGVRPFCILKSSIFVSC